LLPLPESDVMVSGPEISMSGQTDGSGVARFWLQEPGTYVVRVDSFAIFPSTLSKTLAIDDEDTALGGSVAVELTGQLAS